MAKHPYVQKDHYYKKAQRSGLRARSAFKVDEIARRFAIFAPGQTVLDLGAAPGGFLQIILGEVGSTGTVVGVDLVPIRPMGKPNVKTAEFDVLAHDFEAELLKLHPGPFDVVVSDLAPKTSGIKTTDEARSINLVQVALGMGRRHSVPGGHFIAKLFMGGDFEALRNEVRAVYREVKVVRPEATRGRSMEVYLVGLSRRDDVTA